jgi:hypothetical protein
MFQRVERPFAILSQSCRCHRYRPLHLESPPVLICDNVQANRKRRNDLSHDVCTLGLEQGHLHGVHGLVSSSWSAYCSTKIGTRSRSRWATGAPCATFSRRTQSAWGLQFRKRVLPRLDASISLVINVQHAHATTCGTERRPVGALEATGVVGHRPANMYLWPCCVACLCDCT